MCLFNAMANKITGTISILIYLTTLIITIVEITKAKLLYNETCKWGSCWAFFIAIWTLAIPAAFLSLMREAISLGVTKGHRKLKISSAVIVWAFWFVVLVIGWVPIRFPREVAGDDSYDFRHGDFGDPFLYRYTAPAVTGMFSYITDVYNDFKPYSAGETGDTIVLAQAGYGAAIMATLSL